MDILYNNKMINDIVQKLFKHRRSQYSQYNLDNIIDNLNLEHQIIRVMNPTYEKIYGSLFQHKINHNSYNNNSNNNNNNNSNNNKNIVNKNDVCIIFLHGYGSNRLECCNILKSMSQEYSLCSFDFSGSGKSQGDRITYGAKEKQDINSILNYLRQAGFKRFILWGRSMGATSALLYCLKYNPKDVILQIIDSPFYSFQMIAFEIAQKNVKAPQFIINFAIQLAKKNCSKFQNNPFNIQLNDIDKCKVDALFIYCEQDNVISPKNTHLICSKFKHKFQKLVIQQNHNTIRNNNTITKIYQHIQKYLIKNKYNYKEQSINININKNINKQIKSQILLEEFQNIYFSNPSKKIKERLQKKQSQKMNKSINKRGIQRVEIDRNNKYDDYGFATASNQNFFHQPINITPRISQLHSTGDKTPSKRPYLSLTTSIDSKNSRQNSSKIKRPDFKSIISQEIPSIYQVYSQFTTNDKSKMKKLSTVKSIQGNHLNHKKYIS